MKELLFSNLTDNELEAASHFARNNFENSLAIFYNDEGVEQFHDSVSDYEISERMQQLSQFFILKADQQIVAFIELYRRRHIALLLLEKSVANSETVGSIVRHLQELLSSRERDLYLTIHAAPSGYPIFKELGFRVTGEEQIYAGGICSKMSLHW